MFSATSTFYLSICLFLHPHPRSAQKKSTIAEKCDNNNSNSSKTSSDLLAVSCVSTRTVDDIHPVSFPPSFDSNSVFPLSGFCRAGPKPQPSRSGFFFLWLEMLSPTRDLFATNVKETCKLEALFVVDVKRTSTLQPNVASFLDPEQRRQDRMITLFVLSVILIMICMVRFSVVSAIKLSAKPLLILNADLVKIFSTLIVPILQGRKEA